MHEVSDSSERDDLPELLVRSARALRRGWATAVEPWDLSPHQARALRTVGADEALRPSELARRLRIAPRSATEVVDALVERGLVARTNDPRDRRAQALHLTAAGARTLRAVEQAHAADVEVYLARLNDEQRAALTSLLRRLVEDEA